MITRVVSERALDAGAPPRREAPHPATSFLSRDGRPLQSSRVRLFYVLHLSLSDYPQGSSRSWFPPALEVGFWGEVLPPPSALHVVLEVSHRDETDALPVDHGAILFDPTDLSGDDTDRVAVRLAHDPLLRVTSAHCVLLSTPLSSHESVVDAFAGSRLFLVVPSAPADPAEQHVPLGPTAAGKLPLPLFSEEPVYGALCHGSSLSRVLLGLV